MDAPKDTHNPGRSWQRSRALSASFLFLCIMMFLECRLHAVPNSYNLKISLLDRNSRNIEVLTTGDSHAYYGIKPGEFCHKGFNLANSSQSLYFDAQLIERYITRLPNLKLVVIPISYFSLESRLADTGEPWRDYYYFHFFGLTEKAVLERLADPRYASLYLVYGPKTTRYIIKNRFQVSLAGSLDATGWYPVGAEPPSAEEIEKSAKERVSGHERAMKTENIGANRRCLESAIADCLQHKIKVVLITLPVDRAYFERVDKEKLARMHNIINRLCDQYGVRYVDYFADRRFTGNDFWDADHLNIGGAAKLSGILNKEVIIPSFANHAPTKSFGHVTSARASWQ